MKTLLMASLLLALTIQNGQAGPVSFEDFKQLPPKEQNALFDDLNNPDHFKFLEWIRRLSMGEAAWRLKEQERLVDKNGSTPLAAFFIDYQHLQESFLRQDYERRIAAGLPATEKIAEVEKYRKMMKTVSTQYNDAIPLLAALAQTNEALDLNKRAHDLTMKWDKQWPMGTGWLITRNDMAAINQDAQTILDNLNKLPKMTPKEEQAALDALPPEDPSK